FTSEQPVTRPSALTASWTVTVPSRASRVASGELSSTVSQLSGERGSGPLAWLGTATIRPAPRAPAAHSILFGRILSTNAPLPGAPNAHIRRIDARRANADPHVMDIETSPLALPFPAIPPIDGVTLRVARARYKEWDRCDLTYAELAEGTSVAGVFTKNVCCSSEVELGREQARLGS